MPIPSNAMKSNIFTLGCLSFVLVFSAVGADKNPDKDYHLVQSQIRDEVPMHGPVESATVYVLVYPDRRLHVFRAFHSRDMEEVIKHFPRGSVLHYDGSALLEQPKEAQRQALTAFCKSKGIDLEFSPTN